MFNAERLGSSVWFGLISLSFYRLKRKGHHWVLRRDHCATKLEKVPLGNDTFHNSPVPPRVTKAWPKNVLIRTDSTQESTGQCLPQYKNNYGVSAQREGQQSLDDGQRPSDLYHTHGGAGCHGWPTSGAPSAELAILGCISRGLMKISHCLLSGLTAFRPNQPDWENSSTMQQAATVPGGEPNLLDSTGLCLLSLDSGRVCGLLMLYILKGLMDWLNHEQAKGTPIKKLCEVFDLIRGTSTGG